MLLLYPSSVGQGASGLGRAELTRERVLLGPSSLIPGVCISDCNRLQRSFIKFMELMKQNKCWNDPKQLVVAVSVDVKHTRCESLMTGSKQVGEIISPYGRYSSASPIFGLLSSHGQIVKISRKKSPNSSSTAPKRTRVCKQSFPWGPGNLLNMCFCAKVATEGGNYRRKKSKMAIS